MGIVKNSCYCLNHGNNKQLDIEVNFKKRADIETLSAMTLTHLHPPFLLLGQRTPITSLPYQTDPQVYLVLNLLLLKRCCIN